MNIKGEMMRKVISVVAATGFLALSHLTQAAENKIGFGYDHGLGVAAQFQGVNAFLGNDGVGADYLLKQGRFDQELPLDWYLGVGGYYNWDGHDELGARVPFGITFSFADNWDLFGQVSPGMEYDLDRDKFDFALGVGLGIRYAF